MRLTLFLMKSKSVFGRTGKWISFDYFGIIPEAAVLGKSLGDGLAISFIVASKVILNVGTGIPMFTTSKNPISCAASFE